MLALAFALVLLQQTFVVDDDGGVGVDFTDLPPAIAAANDDDLLLVRPGDYTHFDLTGKGLRLVAEVGARVTLDGASGAASSIADLPGDSLAVIEGLEFAGGYSSIQGRLAIRGDTTRALLRGVLVNGAVDLYFSPALRVSEAWVSLADSIVVGGPGYSPMPSSGGSGGDGLLAESGAFVHIVASSVRGGGGVGGGPGGTALRVESDSRVWIAGSTLTGGPGAFALSGNVGDGGIGLWVLGGAFARVSGAGGDLGDDLVEGGQGWCPQAPGIRADGGARVVVHDVPVRTGYFVFGGCDAEPQTSGFVDAAPLPRLEVRDPLSSGPRPARRPRQPDDRITIEITSGPPGAPFAVWLADPATVQGPWLLPRELASRSWVGEVIVPFASTWLASGHLSAAGSFTITLPSSALGAEVHEVFALQAGVQVGSTTRLSNAILRTRLP